MPGEFKGHQPDQNKPKPETREEIDAKLAALRPGIYNFCYQYLNRSPYHINDVQDVVQTTMMKAYKHWDSLQKDGSRESWLLSIATHTCLDYLRKAKGKFNNLSNAYSIDDFVEGEGEEKNKKKFKGKIWTWPTYEIDLTNKKIANFLFSALSPEEQKIIRMQIVEGIPVEKIAKITGMNENTLKVNLFRARQKMKAAYLKQQKIIEHNKKTNKLDKE